MNLTHAEYDAMLAKLNQATAGWQECAIELGQSRERVKALEAAISDHNSGCELSCGRSNEYNAKSFGCESYLSRGMQCPNCPMDDLIEMPQSETFVKPRHLTQTERAALDRAFLDTVKVEGEITETKVGHESPNKQCPCKGHPFHCFDHPHNCGCTSDRGAAK
jgi:hypothetical protein